MSDNKQIIDIFDQIPEDQVTPSVIKLFAVAVKLESRIMELEAEKIKTSLKIANLCDQYNDRIALLQEQLEDANREKNFYRLMYKDLAEKS